MKAEKGAKASYRANIAKQKKKKGSAEENFIARVKDLIRLLKEVDEDLRKIKKKNLMQAWVSL